jgi:hypothetical protein
VRRPTKEAVERMAAIVGTAAPAEVADALEVAADVLEEEVGHASEDVARCRMAADAVRLPAGAFMNLDDELARRLR